MDGLWIVLSLVSAFSLATSDALTKRALRIDNEYIVAWLRLVFSLPALVLLLTVTPVPSLDGAFFTAFIIALPLEILALVLYIKALRTSPMSLTLPFLALTPAFLIMNGWIILGEEVSLQGAAGILLTVAGGYIINIRDVRAGVFAPLRAIARERGSLYMMGVAFIYSITSVLGKVAILHSSPLFFGGTYFIAVTLFFTPFVYLNTGGKGLVAVLRREAGASVLPGLFFALMIVSHMFAITMARVAYMIAVKRSSLLIGSIYGFVFFREGEVVPRFTGAVVMFSGFLLIVFA